jgi:hypothetical protein
MEEIDGDMNDDMGPPRAQRGGSGAVDAGARGPRPRGAVTGGWGFDSADGDAPQPQPVSRTTAEPPSPISDRNNNKKGHFDGDDDVVPTIPDLEEEAEEDITRQVAAPPTSGTAYTQPVRSVRELDVALSGGPGGRATQLPASPEEGVDLASLMQCLCSERQVFEADANWDHELIFQEVARAINADLAAAEEGGGEESNQNDHMGNAAP